MIFSRDRGELRSMYADAWRKRRDGLPMSALETQIADVIEAHPEYHDSLTGDAIDRDYTPEGGSTNPFLHMGLHLALREQLATDRPPGIRAIHRQLLSRATDTHSVEHRMIECLAETLWEAQSAGRAPDETAYLERLRHLD